MINEECIKIQNKLKNKFKSAVKNYLTAKFLFTEGAKAAAKQEADTLKEVLVIVKVSNKEINQIIETEQLKAGIIKDEKKKKEVQKRVTKTRTQIKQTKKKNA